MFIQVDLTNVIPILDQYRDYYAVEIEDKSTLYSCMRTNKAYEVKALSLGDYAVFYWAFWNRWTLGLDFGPGKRWTLDRYFDPKTLWTRVFKT